MAKKKRRGKRKGKEPAGLRRHRLAKQRKSSSAKHKRKGTTVAKKRKRKGSKRSTRRRSSSGGGGGGKLFGIGPTKSTQMDIVGAGVYGFLEGKAKADAEFMLNKIPRPVPQLGYSGGTALALYLANKFLIKNKYVEHLANGAASVAMYQMGRQGAVFQTSSDIFTISGGDDDVGGYIDDNTMGALAAEGDFIGDDDDISGEDDLAGDDDVEGLPTMGVEG